MIAHRLDSILGFHLVVVLDAERVAEVDSPVSTLVWVMETWAHIRGMPRLENMTPPASVAIVRDLFASNISTTC
jgi:hypothetical protein